MVKAIHFREKEILSQNLKKKWILNKNKLNNPKILIKRILQNNYRLILKCIKLES
jgi:hypothetical protein